MKRLLVLSALAVLIGAAPSVTLARIGEVSASVPTSVEDAEERLSQAMSLGQGGSSADAYAILQPLVTSAGFAELNSQEQFAGYFLLGAAAFDLGKKEESLAALRRATEWAPAPAEAWSLRLRVAASSRDDADSITSLTHLARHFPAELAQLNDGFILSMSGRGRAVDPTGEARFQLLDALYEAHWKPQNPFYSTDQQRVDLAEYLVARGDVPKARAVLSNPLGPDQIVQLRINKSFDPVTRDRKDLDVAAAAERELRAARAAVAAAPHSLTGVNALANRLLDLGRDEEALALTDDAIARAAAATIDKPPFDDLDRLNWTYNSRAQALNGLGRYDEAVESLKRGSRRPEHGALNVSQAINLGQYLNLLGRPQDALNAVGDVTRADMSGYGWLSTQYVRVCAYTQLGQPDKAEAALDDILAHKADGLVVAQDALYCAGDDDRAASLAIERLQLPGERGAMLRELQDYLPEPHPTPIARQLRARMEAVRARPDVQMAIAKVGRIERQPISSPGF